MTEADRPLTAAVRATDIERIEALVRAGHDVEERTQSGWTPLCFAAASGDLDLVSVLLNLGANVFARSDDLRTPYLISLAAGHEEVCRLLKTTEEKQCGDRERISSRSWERRPYCRGFRIGDLRRFSKWNPDHGRSLDDDDIVFVHKDFSVTESVWIMEDVVFDGNTSDWQRFCAEDLQVAPDSDLDLLAERTAV